MRFSNIILTTALLFISIVAEASFSNGMIATPMVSASVTDARILDRTTSAPVAQMASAQAPSFEYKNSMLDRKININVAPRRSGASVAGGAINTRSASMSSRGGAIAYNGGSYTGSRRSGNGSGRVAGIYGAAGRKMNPAVQDVTVGGVSNGNINSRPNTGNNGGLDLGGDDRRPGELTPVGDAVIPMIILLLCYCLYLLTRGEAREDREEVK